MITSREIVRLLFGAYARSDSSINWLKINESHGPDFVGYFQPMFCNEIGRETFRRRFLLLSGRLGEGLILDIGCGFGEMELMVSMNGKESVGVDINRERLDVARKWLKSHSVSPLLVVADANYLPFVDSCFETVLAVHFIHHVAETKRFHVMSEFARCLRPRGRIVLHEANGHSFVLRLYRRLISMASDHLLTPAEVQHFSHLLRMQYRVVYCFFLPPFSIPSCLSRPLRFIELLLERLPMIQCLSGAFVAESRKS